MFLLTLFSCYKKDIKNLKNDVSDLKTRVAILEETCKQNNTNIVALQTIVTASNEGDYVTSVTPITKDGDEIGYTISFKDQKPITIYHGINGTNGTNGTNGVNGESPVIGVAEFESVYYWTLNGEWLLDGNGNKMRVIGENGTDGTNGANGVTPQLKVEDDNWYVSYDNGNTWIFVSKAKGDKGNPGETVFNDVTYDESYVYFTLADGTQLKLSRQSSVATTTIEGAIKAAFSVAEGKQVYFSQGNLQYQASTGWWRFAEHQYDVCDYNNNQNVSSSSTSWIDLFGWGTSGWSGSGAICYQPWSTSKTNTDYYVGGSYENNLTGEYANADWGVYNKIVNGGNTAGIWRTLTKEEWDYLLFERNNASQLFSQGKVNNVTGFILLPDNWDLSIISPYDWNFTIDDWNLMQTLGAVFLPWNGIRRGVGTGSIGYPINECIYWSSSQGYLYNSWGLRQDAMIQQRERYSGGSVRLVRDIE